MVTQINEPIKVGAVFWGRNVTIRWFVWKGRRVDVQETTFAWQSHKGARDIRNFALSSGSEVYEVSFAPADLSWRLERVHVQ